VGNPQHSRDGNGCLNKARFEFPQGQCSVVLVKPSKPSPSLRYGAERHGGTTGNAESCTTMMDAERQREIRMRDEEIRRLKEEVGALKDRYQAADDFVQGPVCSWGRHGCRCYRRHRSANNTLIP
jgi:hypothetical protein